MVDKSVLRRRRAPMHAVVDSRTASWLLRTFPIEHEAAGWAAWARSNSLPLYADQLESSVAQLREAALQRADRLAGSESGTAEPVLRAVDAQWSGDGITTTEAAAMLNLSDEMVRRLLRTERLRGRQRSGAWIIDRASVDVECERRRFA